MTTINDNHYVMTMLDDGETWCSSASVILVDKEKFVKHHIDEHDYDKDTTFDDIEGELTEWKEWHLDEEELIAEQVDAEYLMEFYLIARTLGLDKVVNDVIDGVRAAK
jgi:hypothetical protein